MNDTTLLSDRLIIDRLSADCLTERPVVRYRPALAKEKAMSKSVSNADETFEVALCRDNKHVNVANLSYGGRRVPNTIPILSPSRRA